MRVLITNNTLATPAGTEMYVRDLALALLRRGHQPIAYSTQLGTVAQMLHDATVPVVDDLNKLAVTPDVIHGHHHLDTMTAMLHFSQTPVVYFCHGWMPWEEMPVRFPTLQHYVAVDDLCAERLQCEHGIAPEHIHTIRNFVDLSRFGLRDELPAKPQRALVFSNRAHESGYLGIVRRACAERGIVVGVIGAAARHSAEAPEQLLGSYDIVFAKARSALEAMACGAAVITCDALGLGGMITQENYAQARALNFGVRTLYQPISAQNIRHELDLYDAQDAHAVALHMRSDADMEPAIDAIVDIYARAIADLAAAPAAPLSSQLTAASDYLRKIAIETKRRGEAENFRAIAQAEMATQRLRAERAEQQNESAQSFLKTMYRMSFGAQLELPTQLDAAHTLAQLQDESNAWQRRLLAAQRASTEQQEILVLYEKQRSAHSISNKTPFWRLFGRAYSTRNSYRDCLSARLTLLRARNPRDEAIESLYDELRAEQGDTSGMLLPPAKSLQHELAHLFTRLNIHSLVEIACGHCLWLTNSEPSLLQYTGLDLIPSLAEQNRRRFGRHGWNFEVRDVVVDGIPRADAVLCRDWLEYLPIANIGSALHHMRVSGAKYLIVSSDPAITTNFETRTGTRRALNLMRAPFNLHPPIAQILQDEHSGRLLVVWQLPDA